MAKYFNGFDGFDYRKDVWGKEEQTLEGTEIIHDGIFSSFEHGCSVTLKKRLLIKPNYNATSFSLKLDGERPWDHEVKSFLTYPTDQYKIIWCDFQLDLGKKQRNTKIDLNKSLAAFVKFIRSVPESASDLEQCRFLPAAKEICKYLQAILDHCGVPSAEEIPECTGIWSSSVVPSLPNDAKEWIAAGLYAIVALVLQNGSDNAILFYRPPVEHDPVTRELNKSANHDNNGTISSDTSVMPKVETAPTVLPEAPLYSPEPELPFDLFAHIRRSFQKSAGSNPYKAVDGTRDICPIITPAEIHRKLVPVTREISLFDAFSTSYTGFFLVERQLVEQDCIERYVLRPTTCTTDGVTKKIRVNYVQFEDETICNAVMLDVDKNGAVYSLFPCSISESGHIDFDRADTTAKWDVCLLNINEHGHLVDIELEQTLASYGSLSLTADHAPQPPFRKAICNLNLEFLNYFIVNAETMTQIQISRIQDPTSGSIQLSITVPCPGKLMVIRQPEICLDMSLADQMCLCGFVNGYYNLTKDLAKAHIMMSVGANCEHNPYMCFQYGALLKRDNKLAAAEQNLRIAAQEGIPGAQFELAELLNDRGTPKDISEARQLINKLWHKGYRTYGATQSIDLLNEHQSSDESSI